MPYDPSTWTKAECRESAQAFEGDNQNERAEDFDWRFVADYPISELDAPGAAWMQNEITFKDEEGYDGYYDGMFERPIEQPVVLHLDADGKGRLWDGFHRVGASQMQNLPSVPAIVGVRRLEAGVFIEPESAARENVDPYRLEPTVDLPDGHAVVP